jgi:DNA polymerase III subunit delta'
MSAPRARRPPSPTGCEGAPHPRETARSSGRRRPRRVPRACARRAAAPRLAADRAARRRQGDARLADRAGLLAGRAGYVRRDPARDRHGPRAPGVPAGGGLSRPGLMLLRRGWDDKTGRLRTQITSTRCGRLRDFFELSAPDGGWRVAIVDSADEMNPQAANALLKLLEEPPPGACSCWSATSRRGCCRPSARAAGAAAAAARPLAIWRRRWPRRRARWRRPGASRPWPAGRWARRCGWRRWGGSGLYARLVRAAGGRRADRARLTALPRRRRAGAGRGSRDAVADGRRCSPGSRARAPGRPPARRRRRRGARWPARRGPAQAGLWAEAAQAIGERAARAGRSTLTPPAGSSSICSSRSTPPPARRAL